MSRLSTLITSHITGKVPPAEARCSTRKKGTQEVKSTLVPKALCPPARSPVPNSQCVSPRVLESKQGPKPTGCRPSVRIRCAKMQCNAPDGGLSPTKGGHVRSVSRTPCYVVSFTKGRLIPPPLGSGSKPSKRIRKSDPRRGNRRLRFLAYQSTTRTTTTTAITTTHP